MDDDGPDYRQQQECEESAAWQEVAEAEFYEKARDDAHDVMAEWEKENESDA